MSQLNVALIQTATHWHDPAANRAMFDELFSHVQANVDLIVLPEMFSTGFTMDSSQVCEEMHGPTVVWLRQRAADLQKYICGSVAIKAQGAFYNRFIWATPAGDIVCYDKRHLFRMADEHHSYSPGAHRCIVQIRDWRLCPIVCYDLRFPAWIRNQGNAYDVLLCVANWPAKRQAAWDTLLAARAIENQAYVLAVNILGTDGNGVEYGGHSGVFTPDGQIVGELHDHPQVIHHELQLERVTALRESFPVWQDADKFDLEL